MDYYEMVKIVKNAKPNRIIISSHLNQLKDYRAPQSSRGPFYFKE